MTDEEKDKKCPWCDKNVFKFKKEGKKLKAEKDGKVLIETTDTATLAVGIDCPDCLRWVSMVDLPPRPRIERLLQLL